MLTPAEHKLNLITKTIQKDANIEVAINLKLSGRYQLTVTRDGQITQQTPWFDNLVLNQGKDKLGLASLQAFAGSSSAVCDYAHVGTGTSTAVATQTQLDAFVASAQRPGFGVSSTNSGSPNYITTNTQSYVFPQGAVVGNISEVGVGWTATNGNLFSRARVVDGSNNPTTLALTSIDQLTVVYALSWVPNVGTTSGILTLAGVDYPYTVNLVDGANFCRTTNTSGTLPIVWTSQPFMGFSTGNNGAGYALGVGANVPTPTISWSYSSGSVPNPSVFLTYAGSASTISYTYTAGSYTAAATLAIQPAGGNLSGGVKGLIIFLTPGLSQDNIYWINFASPIPKDNTKRLTLTFTTTWS